MYCVCILLHVELLMKLEEESGPMSQDLEDTIATPSDTTIDLTKSLIDCVEKYINGTNTLTILLLFLFTCLECRTHLMLYVALKDGELIFIRMCINHSNFK